MADQKINMLETLQELKKDELELFKWHLQQADNFEGNLVPLKAGALEDANTREKIVSLIMGKYLNDAHEIVTNVLKRINRNDLVQTFAIIPKAPGQKPQPQSTQATDASGVQKPLIYQATADETMKADFVKKHRNDLIQRVEQVRPIAGDLRDKKILTWQNYGNLTSKKNSYDQMIMLFDDFLLRKGTAAMSAFYDVLQTYEPFLVKDLGPIQNNRKEEVKDDQYKLTSKTTGLSATRNNEIFEKPEYNRPGTNTDADGPFQSKTREEIKVKDDQYKLTSKPTGLCVIMNNENFKNPKDKRNGTNKDADDLADTFSCLGFRVLMCKDQTMSQMQKTLKRFSTLKDLTELQESNVMEWSKGEEEFTDLNVEDVPRHGDAFVCCILSHGTKGAVSGTDWKHLHIDDITTTFNGNNCSDLVDKPKVFIIQACQGKEIQWGVTADSPPGPQEPPTTPVDADFLIAMATTKNNKAWRSRKGTWFIQSLCKQLAEGSKRDENLVDILIHVNKEMAKKGASLDEVDAKTREEMKNADQTEIKQMSVLNLTLRNKVVFSPIPK